MPASNVVELVAPGEHDPPCFLAGGEVVPGQDLVFEGGEERFGDGVVNRHDPTRPIDWRIPSLSLHSVVKSVEV